MCQRRLGRVDLAFLGAPGIDGVESVVNLSGNLLELSDILIQPIVDIADSLVLLWVNVLTSFLHTVKQPEANKSATLFLDGEVQLEKSLDGVGSDDLPLVLLLLIVQHVKHPGIKDREHQVILQDTCDRGGIHLAEYSSDNSDDPSDRCHRELIAVAYCKEGNSQHPNRI